MRSEQWDAFARCDSPVQAKGGLCHSDQCAFSFQGPEMEEDAVRRLDAKLFSDLAESWPAAQRFAVGSDIAKDLALAFGEVDHSGKRRTTRYCRPVRWPCQIHTDHRIVSTSAFACVAQVIDSASHENR